MESSLLGMSLGVVKTITRCMKATKSLILFFIKHIETLHDNYWIWLKISKNKNNNNDNNKKQKKKQMTW